MQIGENKAIVAIRLCRQAGRDGNFEKLVHASDEAIRILANSDSGVKASEMLAYKACVLGYKGYALMKLQRWKEALPYLEESQALREEDESQRRKKLLSQPSSKDQRRKRYFIREREAVTIQQALRECYSRLGQQPPLPTLIKYPRTTHLFDSGGTATTPDDLVLPDFNAVARHFSRSNGRIIVEEKVDGANLGITLCPYTGKIFVQNRSHYISTGEHAQFHRIPEWIAQHREVLSSRILKGGNRILYGEWLAARHSVSYKQLPGLFVAFDIFDKREGRFWSRKRFHSLLKGSGIPVVPILAEPNFMEDSGSKLKAGSKAAEENMRKTITRLLDSQSIFRNDGGPVEGVVLRLEDIDESPWMLDKYKVVRPDFVRGCANGHWASRPIEKQTVDFVFAEEYLRHCYSKANSEEDSRD